MLMNAALMWLIESLCWISFVPLNTDLILSLSVTATVFTHNTSLLLVVGRVWFYSRGKNYLVVSQSQAQVKKIRSFLWVKEDSSTNSRIDTRVHLQKQLSAVGFGVFVNKQQTAAGTYRSGSGVSQNVGDKGLICWTDLCNSDLYSSVSINA